MAPKNKKKKGSTPKKAAPAAPASHPCRACARHTWDLAKVVLNPAIQRPAKDWFLGMACPGHKHGKQAKCSYCAGGNRQCIRIGILESTNTPYTVALPR